MAKEILTREYLVDRLTYNESTGEFFHNHNFGNRYHIGDRADTPGHAALKGYRLVNLLNQKFLAHRAAWLYLYGEWPVGVVDHINGNRGDNRAVNLRDISHKENIENQRKPSKRSTTGALGVFNVNGKYRVRITIKGKGFHIGMYDDIESAKNAYAEAKRVHHKGCTI